MRFQVGETRCEQRRPVAPAYRGGLLAIILVGALLRWLWLDGKPLWFDEVFSLWLARQRPAAIVTWVTRIDQHPPLYYLLLAGWVRLVGDSLIALRMLSVLLSILAIPLLARTAQLLVGNTTAWMAALVLALAPLQVHYAQEARMYALMNLAVALVLFALAHLLTADARSGRGLLRWWALLVLAEAAALWTHNTEILLLVVALNAGVVGAWWWSRRDVSTALRAFQQRGFWRLWWLGQAAVFLMWLPWSAAFVAQARAVDADFWIAPLSLERVWGVFNALTVAHVPAWWTLHGSWGVLGGALALFGLWRLGRRAPPAWLLGALWLLPLLLSLLVSLRRPILHEHILLWTMLPYAVLSAHGLLLISAWWQPLRLCWTHSASALLVLLLVVHQAGGLYGYFIEYTKEPWDEAAEFVADHARPGDLVLFHATWGQLAFDHYYPEGGPALVYAGAPSSLFDSGQIEPKMTKADLPVLRARLDGQARVWLVYTHWWYTDPDGYLPATLAEFGHARVQVEWPEIQVHLFEIK